MEAYFDFIHLFHHKSVLPPLNALFAMSLCYDFAMHSDEKVKCSINKTVQLHVYLYIQNMKIAAS